MVMTELPSLSLELSASKVLSNGEQVSHFVRKRLLLTIWNNSHTQSPNSSCRGNSNKHVLLAVCQFIDIAEEAVAELFACLCGLKTFKLDQRNIAAVVDPYVKRLFWVIGVDFLLVECLVAAMVLVDEKNPLYTKPYFPASISCTGHDVGHVLIVVRLDAGDYVWVGIHLLRIISHVNILCQIGITDGTNHAKYPCIVSEKSTII